MNTPRSILMLLAVAALLPACEKNDTLDDIAGPPVGGAFVKFFNFAVASPAVNFYLGDQKVTGISVTTCFELTEANREQCTTVGAESTNGVGYGSSGHGAGGYYSDVPTGTQTLAGRIAGATDKNLAIATTEVNLQEGKFYSYYLGGIYDSIPKSAAAFIVEDVLPPLDYSVAYVRFVNASATAGPLALVVKNRTTLVETPIGGSVAYQNAGTFTSIPPGAHDLSTRLASGAAGPFTRTNVIFNAGRVYTITARGNTAVTSTMALDNTANR